MKRRDFLKKAGVGAAAAVAATTVSAPAVMAQKTYSWKMVTTWPPKFPVLQEGAERFAKRVEEATGGRIKIQVFAAGELVPPLGVFDAVSAGTVEVGQWRLILLGWKGSCGSVVFFGALWLEPPGHQHLVLCRRGFGIVGGDLCAFQPGPASPR